MIKEAIKNYLVRHTSDLAEDEPVAEDGSIKKLEIDGWKDHIRNQHLPYRRDCRRCLELMGVDSPRRRLRGDQASYCLSYDVVGPMPIGEDWAWCQVKVHDGGHRGDSKVVEGNPT